MKKIFIHLVLGAVISSCSDSVIEEIAHVQNANITSTKAMDKVVHFKDIQTLNRDSVGTRSDEEIAMDIQCLTSKENNDTLLFVYQKPEGGWTIYSTDTRVPAIVAKSEGGFFNELMEIDGARLWIESMKEDMASIREANDSELNFTSEEINNNQEFWFAISSPDEYVKLQIADTYGTILDPPSISPKGHYELLYSTTYSQVYDSVPNLITTDWEQKNNYNFYCPLRTDIPDEKAPAGCVAIAAGQILFYLHYFYGVPAMAPSQAYCIGNISNYEMGQSNYTRDIWDKMKKSPLSAAPLIANIGQRVGMTYSNSNSYAQMEPLVSNVFNAYGISCEFSNYNPEVIKRDLPLKIPVLIGALDNKTSIGHNFIAAGYKRLRTITETHYKWVWDYPPTIEDLFKQEGEYVDYSFSSPVVDLITFNWGWGPSYNYDKTKEWYTLTGDWVSHPFNFGISRLMISNFKVK